jgi:hypothetical protein
MNAEHADRRNPQLGSQHFRNLAHQTRAPEWQLRDAEA